MKKRKLKSDVKIAIISTLTGVVLGASINTIAHTCETQKTEEKVVVETNPKIETDTKAETEVIVERKTSLGEFKITAYCPCEECSGVWGNLTYTGATAAPGRTIAVDPSVIPLGSEVEIDGDTYIAEDIGGLVKGKVIDIYFDTHSEALEWGRQFKEVLLIGD